MNRIHGVTMSNNNKTIESILATGMKHEGIAKDHYCKDGIFIDGWRYGMTKKDYINQSKKSSVVKINFLIMSIKTTGHL